MLIMDSVSDCGFPAELLVSSSKSKLTCFNENESSVAMASSRFGSSLSNFFETVAYLDFGVDVVFDVLQERNEVDESPSDVVFDGRRKLRDYVLHGLFLGLGHRLQAVVLLGQSFEVGQLLRYVALHVLLEDLVSLLQQLLALVLDLFRRRVPDRKPRVHAVAVFDG